MQDQSEPGPMMPIAPARRFVVGALAAGLFAGVSGTPVLAANECRVSVGFHEGADAARRERSLRFVISVGDVLPRAIARLSFVRNEGPHDVRLMFDRLPPLQLMRGQAEPKLGNFPTEVGLKSIECLPAITHSPFHGMHPDGCVHDDGPRVTEPCFHNHFFDRWRTA